MVHLKHTAIDEPRAPIAPSPTSTRTSMRLFLARNDPERTTLVSANGVPHYQVTTGTTARGSRVLRIRRPAECEADSVVGEVEWPWRFGAHAVVRSNVFDGTMQELEVRAFLYKMGCKKFTATRYFLGNDNEEYKWKEVKGVGNVLLHLKTKRAVAWTAEEAVQEGFFKGERKWCLQIEPTSLDIDMVVLTYIIMEKRRRDRVAGENMRAKDKCKEDVGEGGCEGGMDGG